VNCDVCGTPRRAQRQCCRDELVRLRQKLGRVHEVADKLEGERDRLAARLGLNESKSRVMSLQDPWEEVA
jgi:hypothetical protein